MRDNLKNARKAAGLTQQAMADRLHVGLRHYKKIENGETLGSIDLWDKLEDIFNVHQRVLREIHLDKGGSMTLAGHGFTMCGRQCVNAATIRMIRTTRTMEGEVSMYVRNGMILKHSLSGLWRMAMTRTPLLVSAPLIELTMTRGMSRLIAVGLV